ncbi:Proton-dependent oligopeptide transporter family protein [Dioscorea alata]|uniref:Proton-dependent oligopeptide transporter family protein n=1 Tax=Dioscorea alata TaxID=55571 RepID=A0ACB7UAY9_DIOAL|nr:Proton-dependent oligopeptide transporter family protein [Dioscorea alata]
MEEASEPWQGYVDWRNKPAFRSKHGGMLAAAFVLVVEVMENLAFLANASNLVTYLTGFMHFSPSRAANTVTNFMGTCFLLALLGGFLSDAFSTSFRVYLFSAVIEFLGLVILTIQAKSSTLKPPPCTSTSGKNHCEQVSGSKAAMLFAGLYLVALGVGGIKGSLPAHGAEQFDDTTVQGRKDRSTFFNYFVFCLSTGGLIAVTFVVWVEDNKGWQWGFGIATITILLSIPVFLSGAKFYRNKLPIGSPLTTIAKVLVAATCNSTNVAQSPSNAVIDMSTSPTKGGTILKKHEELSVNNDHNSSKNDGMKFLDRASQGKPIHKSLVCTNVEVEDVKIVLRVLPIFLLTIMLSCCLAQLSTFSVQQAATMDTRVGGLTVPPASLPIFPVVFIMILAPIYDHIIIPFARKLRKTEMGISHLQRIGIGLVFSIIAMGVAALVEMKRKRVVKKIGIDSTEPLPITFFWVALQYLFLGSADLFTLAGMLEFFFTEAPAGMKSLATSLSWASLALGYYLSSVLVSIVNHVTGGAEHTAWLEGENLNHYHLERFYWLMCVLSTLNFVLYMFWATKYKYRSSEY